MERNMFRDVDIHKITYKRPKKNSWDFQNKAEVESYYRRLKMLAVSVFEWENLPDGINTMYLEKTLYEHGRIAIFKDTDMMKKENNESPFLALPVALNGRLNVYGIPMFRKAYAVNGYIKHLDHTDSVIVYDNILRETMDYIIYRYAEKLATVERIIEVNLNHTRHPWIITTTEKQKKLLEDVFLDIASNKPMIIVDEDLRNAITKNSEVLNLNVPMILEDLMDYKNSLMNEVLTIIGIGDSSQDKRERLVVKEIEITGDKNNAYALIRLRARKKALEELKIMFPELKDVEVNFSLSLLDPGEREETDGDTNDSPRKDSGSNRTKKDGEK